MMFSRPTTSIMESPTSETYHESRSLSHLKQTKSRSCHILNVPSQGYFKVTLTSKMYPVKVTVTSETYPVKVIVSSETYPKSRSLTHLKRTQSKSLSHLTHDNASQDQVWKQNAWWFTRYHLDKY